jgi:hypothetical protein
VSQLTLDQHRAVCPCCSAEHALTLDGRLWTHGPRTARCRGSQRTPEGARAAARRPAPVTRRRPPYGGAVPQPALDLGSTR